MRISDRTEALYLRTVFTNESIWFGINILYILLKTLPKERYNVYTFQLKMRCKVRIARSDYNRMSGAAVARTLQEFLSNFKALKFLLAERLNRALL
jgi:hypothetical protein